MNKVLVTGATGRLGANVIHRLLAKNYDVRALVIQNDPKQSKLDNLDVEGADPGLGAIVRCPAGAMKAMLNAVDGNAPMRIHDLAIGVDPQSALKEEAAVRVVTVHPEAVIEIPVRGARLGNGFGSLVDQVVIHGRNHGEFLSAIEEAPSISRCPAPLGATFEQ